VTREGDALGRPGSARHQDGDQGRDLFRRRVAAYHPQHGFPGGTIVVSLSGNHSPFSIKSPGKAGTSRPVCIAM
jgi:hypothetical protein